MQISANYSFGRNQ